VEKAGLSVNIMPEQATIEAMVQEIIERVKDKSQVV
jgi:hypothetical protein